ncbi:hypothetical protein ACRAWD_22980 [Caulobacter segnis]
MTAPRFVTVPAHGKLDDPVRQHRRHGRIRPHAIEVLKRLHRPRTNLMATLH